MEKPDLYYPCQVVFSEDGPEIEDVLKELLRPESGREVELWELPM